MLQEPYLASAVARFPIRAAPVPEQIPTMATDGYRIFYNEDFVLSRSEADLRFILAHEVLHCLFGHMDRRQERSPRRWNIAADLAVNGALVEFGFEAAEGVLLAAWTTGLTVEEIYEALPSHARLLELDVVCLDTHLDPKTAIGLSSDGAMADIPSPLERRRLRRQLLVELGRSERLPGSVKGLLREEMRIAAEPQVDWRSYVARFVSTLRRDDYRMYPFNRKHIWRGIYLPSTGVPAPSHLVTAIDTSGSMSTDALEKIVAELDRLRVVTLCRMTVIEFDTTIQRIQELSAVDEGGRLQLSENGSFVAHGRGGTDIRAPFEWIAELAHRGDALPDALLVATDGFGAMPDHAPDYPVMWLTPFGALEQFPFGEVVRLSA